MKRTLQLSSRIAIIFATVFLFTVPQKVNSQKVDVSQLKGMKFRNIGPAGMSGRVTSIDVVLSDPQVIYIGTASGGVWRSTSGGQDWDPIFDDQPLQSIGSITIDQNNPDVIWAGTGEGNPRNSHTSGGGIYKSIDGGKTWKSMGLEQTKTIHRIIIHRDNPDIVYVAALGSAWGANKERGVFRTKDGGKTWDKILYINARTGAADMVVDPSNPNKLMVAMWEYGREPWFFNSGGEGSGLHITFDGGDSWTKRNDKHGLPKGELGRMGLAIAPSKPNVMYALVETKNAYGLYRSTDGGFNWHKRADKGIGSRPFYYADIFVDPKNENRIYNLYSVMSKSEDGGKTFKTILPYWGYASVHPDHHAFWIHPEDPNYMIEGNDGGMAISRDGAKTWRFVENLPLAQFYHINIDNDLPYNVYGGMQDNGSWIGPSAVWKSGGIKNADWQEVLFGDGFDVMPHPTDNRYGYAMYQGGGLYMYDKETGKDNYVRPVHPEGERLRFNWSAAIAQDPFNDCGIYYGSQYVHYSSDCGKDWKIISPDLTTNDTTKLKQPESGGLTIDHTGAENYCSILCISPSSVNKDVIWVGTDDGNIQVTKDAGKNWTNVGSLIKGAPKGGWIAQIETSKHNEGEAYVVINNYRKNDWKPYLFKTTDYGKTWTSLVNSSKVSGHCLSIVQDPIASKLLFLGTENGLYFTVDGGAIWNKWDKGYPSVSTIDMKIHPRDYDLIIGTFGRAAWILDDIRPLRELAMEGVSIFDKPIHVFDIPDAYLVSFRSINGTRFAASAEYAGENKSNSAAISVWLKDVGEKKEENEESDENEADEEKSDKKKDDGKLKVYVFNLAGDTIRQYKVKPDTGLNRIHWNLDRKGVRYPSHSEVKPDAAEPGGPSVLAGKYKIVLEYKAQKDSSQVTVHPDPRVEESTVALNEREKLINEHMALIERTTKSFDKLKEAKKSIEKINGRLEYVEKELKDSLEKEGADLKKKIEEIQELYRSPKNRKGYIDKTIKIIERLGDAQDYIYYSKGQPGENGKKALQNAKREIEAAEQKVDEFFDTDWKTYRAKVEETEMPLFKE